MVQPTTVDIEDLPEPARCALADAINQRFFAMAKPASSFYIFLLIIGGVAALGYALLGGYGEVDTAHQSTAEVALYVGGYAGIAAGVLLARKRKQLRRLLGFTPGVYVLGSRLLDTRGRKLKAYALLDCQPRITNHHLNGVYQQTTVAWPGATIAFRHRDDAWEALGKIDSTLAMLSQAAQHNDFERLLMLDPVMVGLLMMNSGESPDRRPQRKTWILPVAAAVGVAVLSPTTWYVRNHLSLEAAFDEITEPHHVDTWIAHGGDATRGYKRKMQVAMLRALDASQADQLRAVLAKYPDAPADLVTAVKAALKARYQKTREEALALSQAPQVTWYINQVYDRLENDNAVAAMQIEIARTDSSGLSQLDELVASQPTLRRKIVPVAKYFGTNDDIARTERLKSAIEQGLEKFFPRDVMKLETTAKDAPTIEIFYVISPKIRADGTPSFYIEMDQTRQPRPGAMSYPGIQFELGATLKVPGGPEPQTVTFTATPAPTITVHDPDDHSAIYHAMAESVFSDLQGKLVAALGGKGGKADAPISD
ncbi:MAG TPA: hypothetical protein VNO30_23405 [Kofleriaceae bacterium]|nr:hypothetical protein [Kofleriaceae bacterium]